jgi:hypothetical protein
MRRWLAASLVACAAPAAASTFVTTSVEEAARSADAVVRGRVLSTAARLTRDGRGVVTEVEVAVDEAWKGAPGPTVKLVVPGGRAGGVAQVVMGGATFEEGEEVIVFLGRAGETWRVMGLALGKYRVEAGEARSALEGARVLPRALAAGERVAGTMSVAELERRVREAR